MIHHLCLNTASLVQQAHSIFLWQCGSQCIVHCTHVCVCGVEAREFIWRLWVWHLQACRLWSEHCCIWMTPCLHTMNVQCAGGPSLCLYLSHSLAHTQTHTCTLNWWTGWESLTENVIHYGCHCSCQATLQSRDPATDYTMWHAKDPAMMLLTLTALRRSRDIITEVKILKPSPETQKCYYTWVNKTCRGHSAHVMYSDQYVNRYWHTPIMLLRGMQFHPVLMKSINYEWDVWYFPPHAVWANITIQYNKHIPAFTQRPPLVITSCVFLHSPLI